MTSHAFSKYITTPPYQQNFKPWVHKVIPYGKMYDFIVIHHKCMLDFPLRQHLDEYFNSLALRVDT